MLTTHREIRKAFWESHRGLPTITPRRIRDYSGKGKMYNTDTRVAFVVFVDGLCRDGQISDALADRATLESR